jgi:hypothetical protein
MGMIIIYDNGTIYEIPKDAIYEPFPETNKDNEENDNG